MRLAHTMPEQWAVERDEVFIEAFHLKEPLALCHKRLGTDDQYRGKIHPCPKLFNNQSCFNSLAYADLISDQQPGAVGMDEPERRPVLIGYKLNPSRSQGK